MVIPIPAYRTHPPPQEATTIGGTRVVSLAVSDKMLDREAGKLRLIFTI